MPRKGSAAMNPIISPLGTKVYNDSDEKIVRLSDKNKVRQQLGIKSITFDKTETDKNFSIWLEPKYTSKGCSLQSCIFHAEKSDMKPLFEWLKNIKNLFCENTAEAVLELAPRGILLDPELLKKIIIIPIKK